MNRREFLGKTACAAGALAAAPLRLGAAEKPRRPNLLFLMTDQQQGAALSCAGNAVLKTPNLDRLAQSGARFTRAYSACPICVPARTTLLTGQSLCATGISQNGQLKRPFGGTEGIFRQKTFHEVLVDEGWTAEYWGKWHTVPERASCFANRDSMSDGKKAYDAFLEKNGPRALKPGKGEFIDSHTGAPYRPDPIDPRFALPSPSEAPPGGEGRREQRRAARGKIAELEEDGNDSEYGRLRLPAEFSPSAFCGKNVVEAITRLKDGPFSITGSFGAPHPPLVVCDPYYGMFPHGEMPLPANFRDPMENSPYAERAKGMARYQDPATLGYMISAYYGLVREVDDWVGRILDTLERLGLRENTLIVFTSDHGEMLGGHGMYSKMVFYDEAARIPMLMSFPGRIPAGTVVPEPMGHLDVFSTLLDYLGAKAPASQGESLRGLIDRDPAACGARRFCVSEWPHRNAPNYLVRTLDHKFLFASSAKSTALDALWCLRDDPHELRNLIGKNPDRRAARDLAESHKEMLLSWLTRVGSPDAAGVRERPAVA
jgi:arylsulfatase A-like enzyme